jgi:hypothetical protein
MLEAVRALQVSGTPLREQSAFFYTLALIPRDRLDPFVDGLSPHWRRSAVEM